MSDLNLYRKILEGIDAGIAQALSRKKGTEMPGIPDRERREISVRKETGTYEKHSKDWHDLKGFIDMGIRPVMSVDFLKMPESADAFLTEFGRKVIDGTLDPEVAGLAAASGVDVMGVKDYMRKEIKKAGPVNGLDERTKDIVRRYSGDPRFRGFFNREDGRVIAQLCNYMPWDIVWTRMIEGWEDACIRMVNDDGSEISIYDWDMDRFIDVGFIGFTVNGKDMMIAKEISASVVTTFRGAQAFIERMGKAHPGMDVRMPMLEDLTEISGFARFIDFAMRLATHGGQTAHLTDDAFAVWHAVDAKGRQYLYQIAGQMKTLDMTDEESRDRATGHVLPIFTWK